MKRVSNLLKENLRFTSIMIVVCMTAIACGEKDADKVGDAQICLDGARNASQASVCMAKVSGLNSAPANGIRCAGMFISEGFSDPNSYVNAFQAIDSGGGASNLNTLMGLITFKSGANQTSDYSNAGNTFSYCVSSGGKGASLISAFSYIPTAIMYTYYSALPGVFTSCAKSGGTYNFTNCMLQIATLSGVNCTSGNNYCNVSSLRTIVGNIAIATYNISCSTGTAANATLCSTLGTAITNGGGQGNPSGVGQSLLGTFGI